MRWAPDPQFGAREVEEQRQERRGLKQLARDAPMAARSSQCGRKKSPSPYDSTRSCQWEGERDRRTHSTRHVQHEQTH